MTISEKLSVIQAEFKAKKSRYNSFGKYNFRSAEDILEALKPFNAKYKVYFTVTEEMVTTEPLPIMKSTAAIHSADGGMSIECSAIVGVDLQQKVCKYHNNLDQLPVMQRNMRWVIYC